MLGIRSQELVKMSRIPGNVCKTRRNQQLYMKVPRGLKTLHVSFSSTTVGELISEIQGLLLTDVHWKVLVQGVGAAPNALRCLLFCGKSYRPGGTGTEKLLSQINMRRECTADVYLTIMPFSEPPAAEAEAAGTNAGVSGGTRPKRKSAAFIAPRKKRAGKA